MIKLVFCLRRLPHLSRSEFQDYWRNVHGPLVVQRAAALGIRRYVQCHTREDAAFAKLADARGVQSAYDGVAELWIDDQGNRSGNTGREAARAAMELLDDERRFIDLSRSTIFDVQEHELVPVSEVSRP